MALGDSLIINSLANVPANIQKQDPFFLSLFTIGGLVVLAAIPVTSKFAVWAGLAILFLVLFRTTPNKNTSVNITPKLTQVSTGAL